MNPEDEPAPPSTGTRDRRYRFGAVELDLHAYRVAVGGVIQNAPPKVLQLLELLCAAPRRLFTRDELLAALWPGRRVVSDESLSQIIFKLRGLLGEDGECVVTVRGVGVRLDAEVVVVDAAPSPPAMAEHSATPPRRSDKRITMVLVAVFLLCAALFAVLMARKTQDSAWATARGLGLTSQEIHASRADTSAIFLQALAADAQGDRSRARTLLTSLHDADATTPLPAILLSMWNASAGDRGAAREWIERARPRSRAAGEPIVSLYLEFAERLAAGQAVAVQSSVAALLDRRPDAWMLRLVRAQILQQRGQPDLALQDLQKIPVASLADRRLEEVLADRASLGDLAGAQALFAKLDANENSVGYLAVRSRLEYTAGHVDRARDGFARVATLARQQGRADWVSRAQMLCAALDVELGHVEEAQRLLIDALERSREAHEAMAVLDASLMLAQVGQLRDNTTQRDAAIRSAQDEATRLADPVWANMVYLVALRVGAEAAPVAPLDDPDLAARGMAQLVAARRAGSAHSPAQAEEFLQAAQDAGVQNSIAAEEAALLAQAMQKTWPVPPRRDPPLMPYFRLVSRAVLLRK